MNYYICFNMKTLQQCLYNTEAAEQRVRKFLKPVYSFTQTQKQLLVEVLYAWL